jgi:UTP-glucose-1-phosphate uridylyltransferase
MKPTLLILAAGMGSRYGGLKQVDPVGPSGEAIIDYSIYDAIRAGFGKVVFVIRESFADAFKETFSKKLAGKIEVEYVYQELDNIPKGIEIGAERQKPWGTGHAVLVAKDVIKEPFVVINADDFYGSSSYQLTADFLQQKENTNLPEYCMVGYELQYTLSDHGFVSRGVCVTNDEDYLESVVERTSIEKINGEIVSKLADDKFLTLTGEEVVSMNLWGFQPSYFEFLEKHFTAFIEANSSDPKAEFYIPSVVNDLINNQQAKLKVLKSKDLWFGVTYKEDKELAIENINQLIQKGTYPEKLW